MCGVLMKNKEKKTKRDEENIAAIPATLIGIIASIWAYFQGIETGWIVMILIIVFIVSYMAILLSYIYYRDLKKKKK
jgi:membrane protein YdbS with pleckstrin-like domain